MADNVLDMCSSIRPQRESIDECRYPASSHGTARPGTHAQTHAHHHAFLKPNLCSPRTTVSRDVAKISDLQAPIYGERQTHIRRACRSAVLGLRDTVASTTCMWIGLYSAEQCVYVPARVRVSVRACVCVSLIFLSPSPPVAYYTPHTCTTGHAGAQP